MAAERRTLRRLLRGALWVLALSHIGEALVLRHRRGQIGSLPATDEGHSSPAPDGTSVVVAADGVALDDNTARAAHREMQSSGLRAIDLVPGDLPADRMMRLLRCVQPDRLISDPLACPGGAHEAIALDPEVAARMEVGEPDHLDRGDLARLTIKAQRYAPTSAGLRLAPGVQAVPSTPDDRWREHQVLTSGARPQASMAPVVVSMETAHLLAMTAGLLVAPVPGIAALATWMAQPSLVLGRGTPTTSSLLRLPHAWVDNIRTAWAGYRASQAPMFSSPAERTGSGAHQPPDDLFEERRSACPWCDATTLQVRHDMVDLWRHQPITVHLEECTCGHIFQNPALSIAGLDYVYDGFYDGIGDESTESVFAGLGKLYRRRADAVGRLVKPRAWLDVGTGHGHFCLMARQQLPETVFDGLDMGEAVVEAQRRGWIGTAYQGQFPDLAGGLPRSYDVVSMHHYLEHTRDPRSELAAAAKVLDPGGHLLIEVPDPESPWARLLGRYWMGWFQPQHQHLIPCGNLCDELADSGFEVVSVERGSADMGLDILMATWVALQGLAPSRHYPWTPEPSLAHGLWRAAVHVLAAPTFAGAFVADWIKDECITPHGIGNAYRVVAKRR